MSDTLLSRVIKTFRSFWRFAIIWLILMTVAWGLARVIPAESRQKIFYREFSIGLFSVVGLAVGLLLSSWSWKKKMGIFAGVAVLVGGFWAMFRLQGVDGNLIPVFEPRWRKNAPPPVVGATAQTAGVAAPEGAEDWPQFLGPQRDTQVPGRALATDWATSPPRQLWRRAVGTAWSGFAVSGGLAITQEQHDQEEWTVAYRLIDGEPVWKHTVAARYDGKKIAGDGPRANPTVVGSRLYLAGSTGVLTCLEVATGKKVWEVDLMKEYSTSVPDWGYAISPLVEENLVIMPLVGPAASLIARRAEDGAAVWQLAGEGDTYASASVRTLAGKKQIIHFGGRSLDGVDITTGKKLWSYPWNNTLPHVSVPVIVDEDELILSSGYGAGAARIRLSAPTAEGTQTVEEVWKTLKFRAKFSNPTLIDGHLYGPDDGVFACLDAESGDRLWREGDYGHGQQLKVGPHLLVMAENGRLVIVDPQPSGIKEVASLKVFDHQTWNPPVLAGEYLLLRNDREAACYRLSRP